MKVTKLLRVILGFVVAIVISSCGGGGSSSGSTESASGGGDGGDGGDSGTTSNITTSVSKGPVDGADCDLYSITTTGAAGEIMASGTSSNGQVSFSVAASGGTWLVVCVGGTYTDEATGSTLTAPQLRAVVETSGDTAITVSPLTEIAVATAEDLNSVDNAAIATAFGLSGVDITQIAPTDLNSESLADDAAGGYGLALALVSQYQEDQSQTLEQVIESFNAELGDGAFSESTKSDLVTAATNLATSEGSTNIDSDLVNEFVSAVAAVDDTTPPSVSFSPSSITIEVNGQGNTTVSVTDGELTEVTCNNDAVTYNQGSVTSSQVGSFQCTALASDDNGLNSEATLMVMVIAQNNAPIADAGADFFAPTGSSVELDGSESSDSDMDSLSYSWVLTTKPDSSSADLTNASTASAGLIPDVDGAYVATLTVSDGTAEDSATVTITASTNSWIINNEQSGAYIDALVNVQSISDFNIGPNEFYQISATGIPNYSVELTQDDIDALNARPEAASDFVGGQTTAQVGDVIGFGADIGYNITRVGCELGYWPPGPACPSDQERVANIPSTPTPASSDCATSINTMGLMLNGTSIYNWSDGVSYNSEGVWDQLAPEFEIYDVDICSGHAQTEGDYHHHMFSPCLAALFNDNGQAHSPIYGYAADGYPVYGPYYAKGVLAKSAWVKRDYSDTNAGGCGDGTRSCLLVDQYDLSQGTVSTNYPGPNVNEVVESNSGNEFTVVSGYYYQDYYYDSSLTAQGNEYLDEHNGHDHDNLGYHYHSTVEANDDGDLIPSFPYNIGPSFYGDTPGGSIYTCQQLP